MVSALAAAGAATQRLSPARAAVVARHVTGSRYQPAFLGRAVASVAAPLAAAAAVAAVSLGSARRRQSSVVRASPLVAMAVDFKRAAAVGDEVLVRYTGTLVEDGSVFDSSEGREPLSFTIGAHEVVTGFDKAVRGMKVGEKIKVTLLPEEAYGQRQDDLLIGLPVEKVPPGLEVGQQVMLGQGSQKIPVRVKQILPDGSAMLDANSPMAGKTLAFEIELVGFRDVVKGLEVAGWQGKRFQVPFAVANSPVSQVLQTPSWPPAWPYTAADFKRQDESDDSRFYDEPRFVTHIDDDAIASIRGFYGLHFAQAPQGEYSVLDICSSWVSHFPEDLRAKRVAITGMVEKELAANKQATEFQVRNLNVEPKLPYGDNEFDFVTNVVSVDYLNKPREVFQEMHRVLKPGGVAIMSFSNRCFSSKAIAMWVANMSDGPGHCQIVGNYFRFSPESGWRDISSVDISKGPRSNPMWVVTAVKI
mmetsp:Transcript_100149/g.180701  ORF Transcript_100149/g.180701 Transcript_100149/m.180701 type:complete len:475 (-) Transcript_100149:39-1463(-)|eukprot:CAMPEP_0115143620 /NCGR_PEP_ID=MMETSP0227-20121206/60904_1 /TAXON_ID=89957 /ORGANISM="Polarella glacialis, Strain CCMP 1383" /LENGTH=474 /DNA_ID=CAMNT_0002552533 /DNA_START=87 /DNA_END=1511 /DNA_ORIENTATION=+